MDRSVLAHDLAETMQRELMLKARLHEVMGTLEQVSRNSEERHLQSVECVDNLKKANGYVMYTTGDLIVIEYYLCYTLFR